MGAEADAREEFDLEQRGLARRALVGAARDLDAGRARHAERVLVVGREAVGALAEAVGQDVLGAVRVLVRRPRLVARQMGERERRDVVHAVARHERRGLLVEEIAVLDRVGARLRGPLHGLGRRRVHRHRQAPLARDAHGRGQLVAQEHHRRHHVVAAAHDPAGGDELDLVHAVQDLLAHRLDEGVGPVDGDHGPRAPERVVPRGGADRVAAAEEPRSDEAAGGERLAPGHVGPSRHAHHAQRRDAGRERVHRVPALLEHRVGKGLDGIAPGPRRGAQVRVDVPEPGQEPGAPEIEPLLGAGRRALTDLLDGGAVHQHPRVAARLGQERVDQMHAGDDEAHARGLCR